jgi:hypothetical protein
VKFRVKFPAKFVDDAKAKKLSRRARTSKAKGRSFEASVAEDIAKALDADPRDVKRTPASIPGSDIIVHHSLRSRWEYYTECKNQKTLSIPAWIRQAEEGANRDDPGMTPIVVFKQHGNGKKYVVVDFDHFLRLVTGT